MALREVLAELDVKVRGSELVARAAAQIDDFARAAEGAITPIEVLKLKQAEATRVAQELAAAINRLRGAEGVDLQAVRALELEHVRAREAASGYAEQIREAAGAVRELRDAEIKRVSEAQGRALEGATLDTRESGGAGGSLMDTMRTVGGVMLAATAAAATFDRTIGAVINRGDEISDISQRLGMTATQLQELEYVGSRLGVSGDELHGAFTRMTRGAASGSAAFGQLHVRTREANGTFRSQSEIFHDTMGALSRMSDGTRRAALATQVFGRAGAQLATIAEQGPDAIERWRARFAELGGGLSTDVVDQAAAADDAMADFRISMQSLGSSIAVAFLPTLTRMIDGTSSLLARFSEFLRTSSVVQTAMMGLGVAAGLYAVSMAPAILATIEFVAPLAALFLIAEDIVTAFRGGESVIGTWTEQLIQAMGYSITFQGVVEHFAQSWRLAYTEAAEAVAGILTWLARLQEATGFEISPRLAGAAASAIGEAARARAQLVEEDRLLTARESARWQARAYEGVQATTGAATVPAMPTVAKAEGRRRGRGGAPSFPTQITIQGATDPAAVRREVESALADRNREAADTLALDDAEPA